MYLRGRDETPVSYEPVPAEDEDLIALLKARDQLPTVVVLRGGKRLTVHNVAWGYDAGDPFAHVTTNASPFVEGAPIDVFSTEDVVAVIDPRDSAILFGDMSA
jgi:hypothetical protein